jgi:hypothetical protein
MVLAPSEFPRFNVSVVQSTGSFAAVKVGMPFVPGQPEP